MHTHIHIVYCYKYMPFLYSNLISLAENIQEKNLVNNVNNKIELIWPLRLKIYSLKSKNVDEKLKRTQTMGRYFMFFNNQY